MDSKLIEEKNRKIYAAFAKDSSKTNKPDSSGFQSYLSRFETISLPYSYGIATKEAAATTEFFVHADSIVPPISSELIAAFILEQKDRMLSANNADSTATAQFYNLVEFGHRLGEINPVLRISDEKSEWLLIEIWTQSSHNDFNGYPFVLRYSKKGKLEKIIRLPEVYNYRKMDYNEGGNYSDSRETFRRKDAFTMIDTKLILTTTITETRHVRYSHSTATKTKKKTTHKLIGVTKNIIRLQ